ncbi:MaoC/PaaZ C-terminal domain-containing protein [Herbaspirillum sp. RTI4]|uniref:MaoC/PaaZ C-terminal domain-containing protein n=1 Tax=Herbaspirillum sp. RTI4 TaxID=3048640 RepID=UPI002AB38E32|nr:MaoC/PaaZ C-terminal domain-containing protein [Herbaspirillum sp. RTI4]MDY7579750.1 MaoC/PaaZ C-terminal domain-containing protein [Herbaspirillum sp. RTI4]MEA9982724.1 MaoC/PaaZ C-terminal domain-containing protein [Herbaspirillum sp. RTI4]
MAIDYFKLKNWVFPEQEHRYTEKDTILYALGLGLGKNSSDADELRFVYEDGLQTFPSMAVILGHPGLWMGNPESGINLSKVVHGEQKVRLHHRLPSSGTVIGQSRVIAVVDKGADKGALVVVERKVIDKETGITLATVEQISFCRSEGGFSEQGQPSDVLSAQATVMPTRAADYSCDLPTRPEMALLYRLSSDMNPLHADPATAIAAGFPRPILHGMGTYGVTCHAILKTCCAYRPERLQSLQARFSSPVFPGETIRTEIWRDGGRAYFQSRVVERDKVVLSNGVADIAA